MVLEMVRNAAVALAASASFMVLGSFFLPKEKQVAFQAFLGA